MNFVRGFFIFIQIISINGFIGVKSSLKKSFSKVYLKQNTEDISLIQKYKYFFDTTDYNNAINELTQNKLSKIFIDNNYKQMVTIDNIPNDDIYNHYHLIKNINPIVVPNIVEKSSEFHTPIYFVNFTSETITGFQNLLNEFFSIVGYAIPVFLFISFLSFLQNYNNMRNPMNNNFMNRNNNLGNNNNNNNILGKIFSGKNEKIEVKNLNITLNSWAGSPEVIDECKEVISYIENKEKYKTIGAEMPKGILLEGPPGTGKTLLAKAIASETNSTFITMSGSEFVELFVGIGASRVRELFDNARKNKPSIIFIDEIDAVGRQRGAGINMGNDEREQTLNQLLYEMDGFNNNDDIVVIAATNRRDVLDQALLRPGRFDRIIRVPVPDKDSRIKILEFYLKNKNIDEQFDISSIAELTDGFSGAQLKNLINEAAILSVKNNFDRIQEKFIFDAFEKLIVGLIKTNSTVQPSTRLRVAIHESGHSLLALKFKEYFDFQKASIQPTYNGAGGYTIFTEKPEIKDGGLYTKDILKKRLIIAMGGKAAESIYYGDDFVSLGAIQDLKQANSLAKRMIGNFGMGDRLEVFYNEDIGDDSNPFLGRSLALGDKYSERTRYMMDKESLDLVKEAYLNAKTILSEYKDKLIDFSYLLQNNTVLYNKDIHNLIDF
jgi:cell division protease FtsH